MNVAKKNSHKKKYNYINYIFMKKFNNKFEYVL